MSNWIAIKGKCPACGHVGYCTRSADGEVVKCMRRADGAARTINQIDGATGYIFHASDLGLSSSPAAVKAMRSQADAMAKKRLSLAELENLAKRLRTNLAPDRLERYAKTLGVSVRALKAYDIGYDPDSQAMTFPMRDGKRELCGFRCRLESGKKFCVTGSRNGLFIPVDYSVEEIPEGVCDDTAPLLLLMPEGPTDCCAATDLGFRAVGRPSNSAGGEMICELLASSPIRQDVVIVADNDRAKYLPDGRPFWPGIEGALSTAERILPTCSRLRFFLADPEAKDIRGWMIRGGSPMELANAVARSSVVSTGWLEAAKRRLAKKRFEERKSVDTAG